MSSASARSHPQIAKHQGTAAHLEHLLDALGRKDCASVLQKNLDEEKAADQKLTAMAEKSVNRKAT
jgi:ferritin-like metal-binding protein YciE